MHTLIELSDIDIRSSDRAEEYRPLHAGSYASECEQVYRLELLDARVRAAEKYARMTSLLLNSTNSFNRPQWEELFAKVEAARLDAETARRQMREHEEGHGCGHKP